MLLLIPELAAFRQRDVDEAKAHAAAGGMGLHLHTIIGDWAKAPNCFKRDVRAGKPIAHLFDADEDRLRKTCRRWGVKVILVERPGTPRQHIDLCGLPLRRAVNECGDAVWAEQVFRSFAVARAVRESAGAPPAPDPADAARWTADRLRCSICLEPFGADRAPAAVVELTAVRDGVCDRCLKTYRTD